MMTLQIPPFWHGSALHGAIVVTVIMVVVVIVAVIVLLVEEDEAGDGASKGSCVGIGVFCDEEGICVANIDGAAVG